MPVLHDAGQAQSCVIICFRPGQLVDAVLYFFLSQAGLAVLCYNCFRLDLARQCCVMIFIWAFKIKIITQRKMNFITPDALQVVLWRSAAPVLAP